MLAEQDDRSWRANSGRLATIPAHRRREYRRGRAVGRASVKRMLRHNRSRRLAASGAPAQALIVINQPWVKPAAGGRSTEAFMNITATEGASLIGARTESAASVRLHAPGAATRPVAEITLPPAKVVALAPGQYRLMLLRLDKRVRLGDIVHLVLTIRDERGIRDIPVGAVARWRSPIDDERRAHQHHH